MVGPHLQRLGDGQVADEAAALEQHAGAAAYLRPVPDRVPAQHAHLTGGGGRESLDDLHRGGLAGPVDAEQGVDGAPGDREVHAAHGGEGVGAGAVGAGEVAHLDGEVRAGRCVQAVLWSWPQPSGAASPAAVPRVTGSPCGLHGKPVTNLMRGVVGSPP